MRTARIDVPLSLEQRRELDAVAAAAGLTATTAGRLAIVQFCSRREFVLTGRSSAGRTGGIGDFVCELRQSVTLRHCADEIERAISALDAEADGSPDAAGLYTALLAISRIRAPLEQRLRAMERLLQVDHPVTVSIPKALVQEPHP